MSIKPSKDSYYSLESIQIQWSFARNRLDFWIPVDVDVIQCFDRPVKTCQNILWLWKHGQKGRKRTL